VHVTHSENLWSSQRTMQEYIEEVVRPYTSLQIAAHQLQADAHVILVLDVWAVHNSEEFRMFLRTHHPHIHLVFVPANCTSKLQVADVMLQRPFKHGLRKQFNVWAAQILREQIQKDDLVGLTPYLKMSCIKPLILQWCVDSWNKMKGGRDYIRTGWHTCCISLYNVLDAAKRMATVEEAARGELNAQAFVPQESEDADADVEAEDEWDGEDEIEQQDELDLMKARQYGARKSERKRAAPKPFGYTVNSSQIALSEDSAVEDP